LGDLGDKLRRARETLGLNLREVEEATKIRKKYLQALENENFEVIPGRTYTKGFLKIYAKYLNLDPKEILDEYESHFTSHSEANEFQPLSQSEQLFLRKNGKFLYIGIVVVIVTLLIVINLFYKNWQENPAVSNNVNNAENQEMKLSKEVNTALEEKFSENSGNRESAENFNKSNENSESAETSANTVQARGVKLEVQIMDEECWIKVVSDKKEVFQGILKKGESKVFTGSSEVVITLGNAGVAKLIYNGDVLPPLGEKGEVINKTFSSPQ